MSFRPERPSGPLGPGNDQEQASQLAVADPDLATVEHIVVAVTHGGVREGRGIGSGARFGKGKGAQHSPKARASR